MIGATVLVHRELNQILAIIVAELCSGHSPLVMRRSATRTCTTVLECQCIRRRRTTLSHAPRIET